MDLVEIRWDGGHLWMRQRQVPDGSVHAHPFVEFWPWGAWQKIEGVKGDESDERRWPNSVKA